MTARGSAATTTRPRLPVPARLDRSTFLRPIAHRGLHTPAGPRIENTAPAFLAAIAGGGHQTVEPIVVEYHRRAVARRLQVALDAVAFVATTSGLNDMRAIGPLQALAWRAILSRKAAGGSRPLPSWWAAPSAANKSRILTRVLGAAPDGLAFFAIEVRMLAPARAWMMRHTPELALFSWTIRSARERRSAARWADAPIFEGYEA